MLFVLSIAYFSDALVSGLLFTLGVGVRSMENGAASD